jgi:hypothetical protein
MADNQCLRPDSRTAAAMSLRTGEQRMPGSQPVATGARPMLQPAKFVGERFQTFVLRTAFIPFVFIVLKWSGLTLINEDFARSLGPLIDRTWPNFSAQYQAIERSASAPDVPDYAAFHLVLLAWALCFFAYALLYYFKHAGEIAGPVKSDVVLMFVCLFCLVSIVVADHPKPNPMLIYDFHVDRFGLYYLRQFALFATACMSLLMLIVPVVAQLVRAPSRG